MTHFSVVLSSRNHRKELGIYYTPGVIADTLARWAIRNQVDTVLDPSYGSCVFLQSALETLISLGVDEPGKQIYGVDIDPDALKFTDLLVDYGANERQFPTADFLNVDPSLFGKKQFDVIVGNPPYVRHHYLNGERLECARRMGKQSIVTVPGRSSYWVYFVAHVLKFLAPGGRLAMVLPGSFLHANYAKELRAKLLQCFRLTIVILLHERVFDNTEEESVILLGEGFGRKPEGARIGVARTVDELKGVCSSPVRKSKKLTATIAGDKWLQGLISKKAESIYGGLLNDRRTSSLGDWAKIEIGTVTGANDFFLISRDAKEKLGITDRWLKPVVCRSSFFRGLIFKDEDWREVCRRKDAGAFILDTNSYRAIPIGVQRYLDEGISRDFHKRYKCRTRTPWHSVPICASPHAFFQYMSTDRPRLILNCSNATSTNTIHLVNWHEELPERLTSSVALSVLSSLSQLSAELVGRSYGGGVLKMEPSEARRLVIACPLEGFPNAVGLLRKADFLFRTGRPTAAIELADKIVMKDYLGLDQIDIERLRQEALLLAVRRRGQKNKKRSPNAQPFKSS
jgi:adenine-specific DNA-methyltransferase